MTPREEFERVVRWLADNGTVLAEEDAFGDLSPAGDERVLADAYERDHADRAFDGSRRAA